MALTTKSLNYNLITAELNGEQGMAKFKYGGPSAKWPRGILTTFLRYWYMEE